jgi:ATP/maltotriose-dependent transcriptional regulator MalT
MAAFVGGASPQAARTTCSGTAPDGTRIDADGVDDIIQRLVDKSLVVVEHSGDGPRWGMLETLRDYAAARLVESGEIERVLVRHAQHFADFLAPATRGLVGADQTLWFGRIGRERRNLEAALATAVARDDGQLALELTMPLGWYYFMVGEIEAGTASLGDALACGGARDPDLHCGALGLHGWLLANTDDLELAVSTTARAVAMLDRVTDPWVRGMVVNTHAMAMLFSGHYDMARDHLGVLRAVTDRIDDAWIAAISDLVEGEIVQYGGDVERAEQLFMASADAFERVGDQFSYALAITEASEIAELVGHYDRAHEMIARGLAIADSIGFSGHPLAMRARLANIEILRGRLDVAEALHRSLLDDPIAMAMHWIQAIVWVGLASIDRRRGDFEAAERHLAKAWELPRTHTVPFMRSIVLVAQGYLADQQGDADRAIAAQVAGLATAAAVQAPRSVAFSLEGVAGAFAIARSADLERLGAQLLGAADRVRRETGGPMPPAERFDVDRAEARLRSALGDDQFEVCFAAGAQADLDTLVATVTASDRA